MMVPNRRAKQCRRAGSAVRMGGGTGIPAVILSFLAPARMPVPQDNQPEIGSSTVTSVSPGRSGPDRAVISTNRRTSARPTPSPP